MKRLLPLAIIISLIVVSCNDSLTFDNISLDPEISVSTPIISFDIEQDRFFDIPNNTTTLFVSDTTRYTLLSEGIIKDNLISLELTYDIDNLFDRDFAFQVQFLDDNNNVTHIFDPFIVAANSLDFIINDRVTVTDSPMFVETTKFVITVGLLPGANPVDPNLSQRFSFKSSGVLTLRY